jgi:hypothetical protein
MDVPFTRADAGECAIHPLPVLAWRQRQPGRPDAASLKYAASGLVPVTGTLLS